MAATASTTPCPPPPLVIIPASLLRAVAKVFHGTRRRPGLPRREEQIHRATVRNQGVPRSSHVPPRDRGTRMQLGMIGLGRMGANMVLRLMRAGHDCVVFDVSATAVKNVAGEGAT